MSNSFSDKIEAAASWVKSNSDTPAKQSDIASAIAALHVILDGCTTPVLLNNPFPNQTLELLLVPADSKINKLESKSERSLLLSDHKINLSSLESIGSALANEFALSGQDTFLYEHDDGSELYLFLPHVRDTLLLASGIVLLH
jgi:hypothetical protein